MFHNQLCHSGSAAHLELEFEEVYDRASSKIRDQEEYFRNVRLPTDGLSAANRWIVTKGEVNTSVTFLMKP